MKKIFFLLAMIPLAFACKQIDKKISTQNNSIDTITINKNPTAKMYWYDSLIITYIENSNNEMIQLGRKDSISKIEWILDKRENTDSTKYLIFNIGHDVSDSDGTRFITYSWVYIDSLTKKLYEYNGLKDSLIEWKEIAMIFLVGKFKTINTEKKLLLLKQD